MFCYNVWIYIKERTTKKLVSIYGNWCKSHSLYTTPGKLSLYSWSTEQVFFCWNYVSYYIRYMVHHNKKERYHIMLNKILHKGRVYRHRAYPSFPSIQRMRTSKLYVHWCVMQVFSLSQFLGYLRHQKITVHRTYRLTESCGLGLRTGLLTAALTPPLPAMANSSSGIVFIVNIIE